jgi:hypothetical protein
MKNLPILILGFFVLIASPVSSQNSDPFTDSFFEPNLVMKYKKEISLSSLQESKIMGIYESNSSLFSEKKREWSSAMADFQTAISSSKVDYNEVDKMFTQLLSVESYIKKIKLRSLTEIKNELTEDQQSKLDDIKKQNPDYGKAFELTLDFDEDSKLIVKKQSGTGIDVKKEPLVILYGGNEKPTIDKKISSIDDVNPKDIQALSVYKGTAATDRFGDDGKNGVIEIKIKGPALKKYRKN